MCINTDHFRSLQTTLLKTVATLLLLMLSAVAGLGQLMPAAPGQETVDGKVCVDFAIEKSTEYGDEVFVVGNQAELGNWQPVEAVKLHWTEGNMWRGDIAVPPDSTVEYKYIIRTNLLNSFCDENNVQWPEGANQSTQTASVGSAPYTGKTMLYYSSWTNASLLYRCGTDTNWFNQAMQAVGTGRAPSETLYRIDGVGRNGELIEFVPNGYYANTQYWDNCPIEDIDNYSTYLDVFALQDGSIYNYMPDASTSTGRIEWTEITSSQPLVISSRWVGIYLPRDYDVNTNKYYPVIYMHDGQNVYRPGGAFGSWEAEVAADHMISLGRMRETIIVAINNTDNRMREYVPTGDRIIYDGTDYGAGLGGEYMRFIVDDVKSSIDSTYRTLTGPEDTGMIGSSLGGLISIYMGLATNVFGKVGPMSPSYWAGTNFVQRDIIDGDTTGIRIYMDCGSEEGDDEDHMLPDMFAVCNYFQEDGHVMEDTLQVRVGCGQIHNEYAWSQRVWMGFQFLMNARDEANELALNLYPPQTEIAANPTGTSFAVSFPALKDVGYTLLRTLQVDEPDWTPIVTGTNADSMCGTMSLQDTNLLQRAFYCIQAIP